MEISFCKQIKFSPIQAVLTRSESSIWMGRKDHWQHHQRWNRYDRDRRQFVILIKRSVSLSVSILIRLRRLRCCKFDGIQRVLCPPPLKSVAQFTDWLTDWLNQLNEMIIDILRISSSTRKVHALSWKTRFQMDAFVRATGVLQCPSSVNGCIENMQRKST